MFLILGISSSKEEAVDRKRTLEEYWNITENTEPSFPLRDGEPPPLALNVQKRLQISAYLLTATDGLL